jgi:hypothetical protein
MLTWCSLDLILSVLTYITSSPIVDLILSVLTYITSSPIVELVFSVSYYVTVIKKIYWSVMDVKGIEFTFL